MSILQRQTPRFWYRTAFIVRALLSVHIVYLYAQFSGTPAAKWGTFIEWVDSQANFLPYTSRDDNDKLYQSLLFEWCVYPEIEGTEVSYRDQLCSVTTEDYQRFTVSVLDDHTWSDWTPVTINDVLFTYGTILKENYWNIPALDGFRNVIVTPNAEEQTVTVTFPSPSIDHMIFFTNFVLPSHLLANQTFESYVSTFFANPVWSACGRLQPSNAQASSVVFDLEACEDVSLRYYQVRSFESSDELVSYVTENPQTLDLVFSDDESIDGYDQQDVILNRFVTFFFNTERDSFPARDRENLAANLRALYFSVDHDDVFVTDPFLFDAVNWSDGIGWLWVPVVDEQAQQAPSVAQLPWTISFVEWGEPQEFQIPNQIFDKVQVNLTFPAAYDRVSVAANWWVEYFPASYSQATRSTLYNFNPLFRNIQLWRNTYRIKGYTNGVHVATHDIVVYYQTQPDFPQQETVAVEQTRQPLEVIYFEDPALTGVVEIFQEYLDSNDLSSYFTITGYDDSDTFEWKLTSLDYDIVIRSINMGLRKDLSNLFTSSVPTINPSLYVNTDFADLINRYFLEPTNRDAIKSQIDEIYRGSVPFVILWKELGSILTSSDVSVTYPERLYVLGWRKDFINTIEWFAHQEIDWDKFRSGSNIVAFINSMINFSWS